jgi:hypothetical protein
VPPVAVVPSFARYLGSDADRALFAARVAEQYGRRGTHPHAAVVDAAHADLEALLRAPVGPDLGAWTELRRADDATLYRLNTPPNAGPAATTTMGVAVAAGLTPAELYAVISAGGARTVWDPIYDSSTLVRSLSARANIGYGLLKGTWPVQPRDVVLVSDTTLDARGTLTNVARSVVDPACPEVPGRTRADVWLAAWRLEPVTLREGEHATKVGPPHTCTQTLWHTHNCTAHRHTCADGQWYTHTCAAHTCTRTNTNTETHTHTHTHTHSAWVHLNCSTASCDAWTPRPLCSCV